MEGYSLANVDFYNLLNETFYNGGSGPLKEVSEGDAERLKKSNEDFRVEYLPSTLCGFGFSTPPMEVHVKGNRIIRILPCHLPEDLKIWEIKTDRGVFTRPRKSVPHPHMLAYKNRVYTPTRVKYPLKRVDWSPENPNPENRGKSGFVRISWEEAIEYIVQVVKRVKEKYGDCTPILVQGDGHGQTGFQTMHFFGHYLFDHLGFGWTQQVRNPDSWEGLYWGAKLAWGMDWFQVGECRQEGVWDNILQYCEMIVMSGCDPETTALGFCNSVSYLCDFVKKAGIKLVAVAPDLNYTAAVWADKWIPINPNTDAALYLAIAYIWIKEDLYDKEYIEKCTIGFEEFKRHVLGEDDGIPKTPEWAEKITGIPSWTIKALARAWAKKRTSLGVVFGGPKIRGPYSHVVGRIEVYILAMQGLGKPGRQYVRFFPSHTINTIELGPMPCYPLISARARLYTPPSKYSHYPPIGVPLIKTLVPDAILNPPVKWWCHGSIFNVKEDLFKEYRYPPREDHPGIRVIWNENGCYTSCWHGYKFIEALRSPKIEFHLVINPWFENDALFADIVLPALTDFETEDIVYSSFIDINGIAYHNKCIEPLGESKSDYEIHKLIAERLAKEFNKPELLEAFPDFETWIRKNFYERRKTPEYDWGLTWEELKEKKIILYNCPSWEEWVEIKRKYGYDVYDSFMTKFWKGLASLETPSGKIEFVSQLVLKHAPDDPERPPVAKWIEHENLPTSPKREKYPFILMSNHPRYRFHSQGDEIIWLRELYKVRGPDGYMYEAAWINPVDAERLGVKTGDVVMIYNEVGAVLCGALVTHKIKPGVISVDHGARVDMISVEDRIDRGGAINLIMPNCAIKYKRGEVMRVPEQICSGILVGVKKVDILELMKKYPEAFQKKMHPIIGPILESYLAG
ncbi:MAG: molybdopterin-dependent oxidoreductase [Candidatus Bathyarchaeia archaeon]